MAALGRTASAPVSATPPPPSATRRNSASSEPQPDHFPLLKSVRQSRAYAAQHEPRVAHDVARAAAHFPSLRPILDSFTSSDGSSTPLLALRGTVPVRYKGAFYKIPVHLWVMPYHPAGPPLAFVVPTRAMVFRSGHPHVDVSNGLVYLPYLSEWSPHSSSVLGLVHALVRAFEAKPPVYARIPPPARLAAAEGERAALVRKLSDKVHAALVDMAARRSRDVLLARDASRKLLLARQKDLRDEQHVFVALDARLAQVKRSVDGLKWWLSVHPPATGIGIDEDTRPRHALRVQEVGCRASDAALTDAMDAADEAVGKRVVPVDDYVRAVRWMAREQFFERVMLGKARKRLAQLKSAAKARNGTKQELEETAAQNKR